MQERAGIQCGEKSIVMHSYESADGTRAQQEGWQKAITPYESGQAAQGGFSYIGLDGRTYSLSYTADERGYLAAGAHLPTSPPIPAAILRSLAYNAAHPEQDNL
ncbi:hypothetical protein PR048_013464 [Dryococelus australis]|uniref:Uncharacterized protein n=1 Tax=Dryococelus australis TaxID=614101 RepID=A0ABQ9HS94_9NEOP|nr:hypothetical protein PR048_013464 [Dryococelus australis]